MSKLRIGEVLSTIFQTGLDNFRTFFLLSLIFYGLPNLASHLLFHRSVVVEAGSALHIFEPGRVTALVISLASTVLLEGALTRGVLAHLSGARPDLQTCVNTALARFWPLLAVAVLSSLGIAAGFIALLIPGIFLLALWSVAAPAVVLEPIGIGEAFSRSAALTRGRRIVILGVLLALALVGFVTALVLGAAAGAVVGVVLLGGLAAHSFTPLAAGAGMLIGVVQVLVSAVVSVFSASAPAVLYLELRREQEGSGPEVVAAALA